MKKTTLLALCLCLLAVAGLTLAANKDLIFNSEETTTAYLDRTADVAERKTEIISATVVKTTAPTASVKTTKPQALTNPAFVAENITGKPSASAGTYTGYTPLPSVDFAVQDASNSRGLSTQTINHSFGVAKDGKPHQISIDSQNYFAQKGFNAVTYDNKSTQKVLYLTFDCGYENGYTSKVLDVLKEKKVSAAFFCTLEHIKAEPELIARMIKEGHIIGNHSSKHPNFSKIDRTRMAQEIQTCDNYLREKFGYTSPYFRFPEGAYSDCALDLVQSLGYKSVFWSLAYADWDTSAQKGRDYAFNTVTARLHPGAIILLHSVSADNAAALGDIIDYALQQGYVFKPLTALPKN